jgi:NADH-quinone oxidoreductase subunit A
MFQGYITLETGLGLGFGWPTPVPILATVHGERFPGFMSQYFQDYVTVGVFAALGVVLVAAILGVASVVRPSNPTKAKRLTYECGVDPVGSGWSQTYVRYYVFGLLFVVFDVEAVFVFPWAIMAEDLGLFGLVAIVLFMLTLIEGLVYAVKKGVLRWE